MRSQPNECPLSALPAGAVGRVLRTVNRSLPDVGFTRGTAVRVLQRRKSGGVYLLGGRRFALSAELTDEVFVTVDGGKEFS